MKKGILFVVLAWFLSRFLLVCCMQLVAPALDKQVNPDNSMIGKELDYQPKPGWDLFARWDSFWYKSIVEEGYSYASDGEQYNVAFFPLYPITVKAFTAIGVPFNVAGTVLSHIFFFGALLMMFFWLRHLYNDKVARTAILILSFFPYSLFSSIIYTESLFLFLTMGSLWFFDKKNYALASIFGILATATRGPGLALAPAFFLAAVLEKRSINAYMTSIAITLGLIGYSLYCWYSFDDFMVYSTVQSAWHTPGGDTSIEGWALYSIAESLHLHPAEIVIDTLLAVLPIAILCVGLWIYRKSLPITVIVYSIVSLLIAVFMGGTNSIGRLVYVIIGLYFILGLFLSKRPRWRIGILSIFGILLAYLSIRMTWWYWVA